MKKYFLSIVLLTTNFLFAETTPAILQTAFDKMAADSIYSYSYKKMTQSIEETRVVGFDAAKTGDDQWKLISINNQPPTKDELKDFYKQIGNTSEKGKKSVSLTSDEMYDFQKFAENAETITFSCKMNDEKNKKMMDKVLCNIAVNKLDSTLQSFKMELTESVSPVVSVKLDEFSMEMVFQKMADTGANMVFETKTRIKGKAMVFKELDQQVTEKYYDYKLVE